jgi:hypothetical protein
LKNRTLVVFFLLALLASCLLGISFAAKSENSDGKMADVVVKEKDAFKIEKQKPPVSVSVDHMKAVLPTIKTEKYFLDGQADKPETDDLALPFDLSTKEDISPWLHSVVSAPVAEFVFGNSKTDVAKWKLIITDSRGKPFKVFEGKKSLPVSLLWDGNDSKKHFMQAGMAYSYIFEVIDNHGGKNTVIGKPFTLDAVAYQKREDLIVSLALKSVFENKKNGLEVSEKGKLILKEVSDIIRGYFDSKILIKVYAANKPLAATEAKMLSAYFTEALLPPADAITLESYATAPEDYQIEVILSSRKRHMGWKYNDILHNQHNALVINVEIPASTEIQRSPAQFTLPSNSKRLPGMPSVHRPK